MSDHRDVHRTYLALLATEARGERKTGAAGVWAVWGCELFGSPRT